MNKTILQTFVIATVFLWMGSGTDVPALVTPPIGSQALTADNEAVSADLPASGHVREVTAYNVGVRRQTSSNPCVGAAGQDICHLVRRGYKVCAANFVDPGTVLNIEGYGMCVVLDRMNRRFAHRVDIAMLEDEVDRALEFGVQRRHVEVKTAGPWKP